MSQEQGDAMRVDTRPTTPPLTPASLKSGVSAQRSTGKSKYSRKFNSSWIASPSPKSPQFMDSQIPTPLSNSKNNHPSTAAVGASYQHPPSPSPYQIPDSPRPPPPAPILQQRELSDFTILPYSATPGPAMSGALPTCPPAPTKPSRSMRDSADGPRSRLNYSNTSPSYGGEARHRVPVGIIPSPQARIGALSSPMAVKRSQVEPIVEGQVAAENEVGGANYSSTSNSETSEMSTSPPPEPIQEESAKRRKVLTRLWKRDRNGNA